MFFGFDSLPDFRLTTRAWDVRRGGVAARQLEQPGAKNADEVHAKTLNGGLILQRPAARRLAFRGRCRKRYGSKRHGPALVTTDTG